MKSESIRLRGELAARILKNFSRLEDERFTPEAVFGDESHNGGWPGDRDGRVMLALAQLERVTGREAAYLDAFVERLTQSLNERGYRGPVQTCADEQVLSGHNWLLRALIEHYRLKGDARSLALAKGIVDKLYLPLAGRYADYPADPAQRTFSGEAAGSLDGRTVNGWRTSTDIGCAFIALDGLAEYHALTGDAAVSRLLDEMIAVFTRIDFPGLSMQTHASLSATRGILRYYRSTSRPALLRFACDFFDFYMREGMSEGYANYNWFRRPDWTEPCAIVDSHLLATTLFGITGEGRYADIANRIGYSALYRAQRANGGFGCDSCLGAGEEPLYLDIRTEEAYWCCTMRGADGLANMAQSAHMLVGGAHVFTNYLDGDFAGEGFSARVRTDFPYEGRTEMEITLSEASEMRFYIPGADACLEIDGEKVEIRIESFFACALVPGGTHILRLSFPVPFLWRAPIGKNCVEGVKSAWHGPLLLGTLPAPDGQAYPCSEAVQTGKAEYTLACGAKLFPVGALRSRADAGRVQALFAKNTPS